MAVAEEVMKRVFGHDGFRGNQRAVIGNLSCGKHSLVIMPTGMGKSACYQIPALAISKEQTKQQNPNEKRPGVTLVLSPLVALMKDQVDALNAKGVSATFVNSSLNRHERASRYTAIANGDYDMLYVTPERFRKPEFLEVIAKRKIVLLAVDEAHCISEWGHDFRPTIRVLVRFARI